MVEDEKKGLPFTSRDVAEGGTDQQIHRRTLASSDNRSTRGGKGTAAGVGISHEKGGKSEKSQEGGRDDSLQKGQDRSKILPN